MIQVPNYANPYMQVPQVPVPNYNAVKIDVHNPSVSAPGVGQVAMNMPQYAPITNPYYNYPEASMYNCTNQQVQQMPQMMPQMAPALPQPQMMPQMVQAPQMMPAQMVPVMMPQQVCQPCPVCQEAPAQQVIQQQNINAPAPVVTEPQPSKPVEVVPPQPMAPQVDLNSFIAKLTNPDYEVQAGAMEEIANMINDNPQKATELLDEKVVTALNNIINADTSKLEGPTAEQVAAREKLMKGEKISDDEKQLATKITPMEQAERNKSYAMFTSAIMQKLYGDEVAKLTGSTVPLTELPGAVNIVEQLKNNPNPMVRTSAIEALSYIQKPEYKQDLTTIFTIAKNDQDKNVQEAANAALAKLA